MNTETKEVILTSEQIEAANRYEARVAREKDAMNNFRPNPEMKARVEALFESLSANLGGNFRRRPYASDLCQEIAG